MIWVIAIYAIVVTIAAIYLLLDNVSLRLELYESDWGGLL